jgi:hypothetical protein
MPENEKIHADTNEEVRRRRLLQLAEQVGGLEVVASVAGLSAQNLDHIVKRRRASGGEKKTIAVGDKVARRIELGFKLDPGWMDWPFAAVPFHAWTKLQEQDRGFAQAGLLAAIKERIGDAAPEKITVPPPSEWLPKTSDPSRQPSLSALRQAAAGSIGVPDLPSSTPQRRKVSK